MVTHVQQDPFGPLPEDDTALRALARQELALATLALVRSLVRVMRDERTTMARHEPQRAFGDEEARKIMANYCSHPARSTPKGSAKLHVQFQVAIPDVLFTDEQLAEWLRCHFRDGGYLTIDNPLGPECHNPKPVPGSFDFYIA